MAHIITQPGQIVINAILTKAGRIKLASGIDSFNITKFAVADDEIDYSIVGLQTALESNPKVYPILQPVIFGDLMMKNRLYTDYNINAGARVLASILIDGLSKTLINQITSNIGAIVTYTPSTVGSAAQIYTIGFNFSSGQPFSNISFRSVAGGDITQISATDLSSNSQITLSSVYEVLLTKKYLTTSIYFTMNVTGQSTGVTAKYEFKVTPNNSGGIV